MDGQPAWKRWLRKWRGWLLLAAGLAATYAFREWRRNSHEADIREARAAGFVWEEGGNPYDAIREDWRATFRKETWTGSYRVLDLGELPDLTPYRSLIHRLRPTYLSVRGSNNVDAIEGLTSLEELSLYDYRGLQSVDGLKELTALERLGLSFCPGLQSVDGLKGLTSLEELHLHDCPGLQSVDGIKGLTSLQELRLDGCRGLQSVDGLKGLTALQTLYLYDCRGLQNVDALKGLTALKDLFLNGSTGIPAAALRELAVALPKTRITFPDGSQSPPP